MAEEIKKTSEISIKIHLDQMNIPEKMEWSASDASFDGTKECKSLVLSIWDGKDNSALRIDLWTKEMRIDEMNNFFYQTFLTMADTYARATNNKKGADDIRRFGVEFAEKAGVIKK